MSSNTVPISSKPETSSNPIQSMRRLPWLVPATIGLLIVLALELYLSARTESQTFDEPAHLYSGYAYWLRSDFGVNPEHPPLVKLVAALPLLLSRPAFQEPMPVYFRGVSNLGGMQLMRGPGSEALLGHARTAVSIFVFLLAVLVTLAANEMFGSGTALVALLIFVFDPVILANAPLVATDMGAACLIFATVYAFYRYVKRPSVVRLLICALAAGLALAAKHSTIFVIPILILLCLIEIAFAWRRSSPDSAPTSNRSVRPRTALRLGTFLLAIGIIAVAILWAFYGFRYRAFPDNKTTIIPPTEAYLQDLHHPVEATLIGFAEHHHLLPEAYLFGLTDVTIICRDGRVMYLFGKVYPHGRWFYFPAALLIKSTLGFLILLALLPFARALWGKEHRREILYLAVPAVAFFGWAMTSKLDLGIRHILPVFPFLIVLVAAGAVSLARRSRVWAWAVSLLLFLHIASSLYAAPNYMPYSNEIVGGPDNTHRMLSDANVGWGGGLKALSVYLREHHISECWFAYSAFSDPATFGIPCKRLPTFFTVLSDMGQQRPVPEKIEGPVFISSEETAGSLWGAEDMNPYQQFATMRPNHVVAGEILEFDGTFSIPRIAAVSHYVMAFGMSPAKSAAPDSIAHAESAVALDPASLFAHEALLYAYAAHGRKDDALREYQAAMNIFNTVHPEFQADEFPPRNPYAGPQH